MNHQRNKYGYSYDNQHRLTAAYYQVPGTVASRSDSYSTSYSYDENGNILNLKRNGTQDWHLAVIPIDDLHYRYDEGNRLKSVRDAEQSHFGYNDRHTNANVDDFEYDDYGNMVKNRDKEIATITYNHLSLPVKITFTGGETIEYTYLADGTKLKKTAKDVESNTATTEYRGGFQYKNNILEFFPHSEGYVKALPETLGANPEYSFHYIFTHTDHLGNIRVKYTKHPQTGELTILEENHYYPYGLTHEGYNGNHKLLFKELGTSITIVPVTPDVTDTYKYKFNGMEWQDEFDVNMYDFGARNYDPALGRWMNIDPLSEMMRRHSPYNYAFNNPVFFIEIGRAHV